MAERTVSAPAQGGEGVLEHEATRAQEQFIRPPVDIYETPEGLVLVADLPGVQRENLDVQVKDSVLSITARTGAAMPGTMVWREYALASFFREFQIGAEIDQDDIAAELRNGVLTLTLRKAPRALPRKIEVQYG